MGNSDYEAVILYTKWIWSAFLHGSEGFCCPQLKMLKEEQDIILLDCAGFDFWVFKTICNTSCPTYTTLYYQVFGHGCSLWGSFKPWLFSCSDKATDVAVAWKERIVEDCFIHSCCTLHSGNKRDRVCLENGLSRLTTIDNISQRKKKCCLSYSCLSSPGCHLQYFLWSTGEVMLVQVNDCRVNAAVLLT